MKDRHVQIRISEDDLERIDGLAREAGVSRSEYVRRAALAPVSAVGESDRALLRSLKSGMARQGNNLNQIARTLHQRGEYPGIDGFLSSTLAEVKKAAAEIAAALKREGR